MSISAVVLTKNSSKTIERCLDSLTWCDEIVIIDDNSTDTTISLAKKYGANIFTHSLDNDFSRQRNFGLEKAKGDWVLFVDSDEEVSPALQLEINEYTNKRINKCNGYFIKRLDTMWGKKLLHGETGDIWLLRLAKKDTGIWHGKVHETWHIKGETQKLKNILDHFPHPTVSAFLSTINFYTTLRAQELYSQKVSVLFLDIILYPKGKFFANYFLRMGFLDGTAGFLVAVFMSFHSFLVRGKLWQLQHSHQ